LNLTDFNFYLPKELIALDPPKVRGESRLLLINDFNYSDHRFLDLQKFLTPGDLLIINDTKVLKARLIGKKKSGAKVEIMVEKVIDDYHVFALTKSNSNLKEGDEIIVNGLKIILKKKNGYISHFFFPKKVREVLDEFGKLPLPPYIRRAANDSDLIRYQTVYANASKADSVAAPTAGLHFNTTIIKELKSCGIEIAKVTLNIGFSTFKPMKAPKVENHEMHEEEIEINLAAIKKINKAKKDGKKVIAVGTTVLRCLEAVSKMNDGTLKPYRGETDLFIYPGFSFNQVDALLTNFHLPQSSLFVLVSAFGGVKQVKEAYEHAINNRYKFFSYGDATLIFPILK